MTISKPSVLAVIPARYGSSRFPGKPLADMNGKPMIVRVLQQAHKATLISHIVVATDDERIVNAVEQAGYQAVMTQSDHPSGTDRVWEVAQQYPQHAYIVNIQGDEPAIEPAVLDQLTERLINTPQADLVTPLTPIKPDEIETLNNPNAVKAVIAPDGKALYFSRSPIPYVRNHTPPFTPYRHIGLYGYQRHALEKLTQWPPSPLEQLEQLEQLRALENSLNIYTFITPYSPIGVDTPEDLATLNKTLYSPAHY